MKEIFEEIERIGSEKYKYYGNAFCNTNNYDVHNAVTQIKIVELLSQLVGKVDELITKLPSQEKVEPVKVEQVKAPEEKVTTKAEPKTTKRATTRKTKDSK